MTREKALRWFEKNIRAVSMPGARAAHEAAIRALRPVSREQVEKMKGVWIFNDDWWEFRCSECHKGIGNIEKFKFCPHCGAPMTDEAVQMVMERLEEIQNEVR